MEKKEKERKLKMMFNKNMNIKNNNTTKAGTIVFPFSNFKNKFRNILGVSRMDTRNSNASFPKNAIPIIVVICNIGDLK